MFRNVPGVPTVTLQPRLDELRATLRTDFGTLPSIRFQVRDGVATPIAPVPVVQRLPSEVAEHGPPAAAEAPVYGEVEQGEVPSTDQVLRFVHHEDIERRLVPFQQGDLRKVGIHLAIQGALGFRVTVGQLLFLDQELLTFAAVADGLPEDAMPGSHRDRGIPKLLLKPSSEKAIEADEEHPVPGPGPASRILDGQQCLPRAGRTLEQAARVVFEFVQPVVLLLGQTQQLLLGAFDAYRHGCHAIELRPQEVADRLGLLRFGVAWPTGRLVVPQTVPDQPPDGCGNRLEVLRIDDV